MSYRTITRVAFIGFIGSLAVAMPAFTTAHAAGTPTQICNASKLKAAGTKAACRLTGMAKIATGGFADLSRCSGRFSTAFTRAETKATTGVCPTEGDTAAVEGHIDTETNRLQALLSGVRFVDNGDGTVTDNQTRLQWEKKNTAYGSGVDFANPHDVDNIYDWSPSGGPPNGTAFTDFLGKLNDCSTVDGISSVNPGFAGHCDWRLPTIQELKTLIDLTVAGCNAGVPCIDPIFGPTATFTYWSATVDAAQVPLFIWGVDFTDGFPYLATDSTREVRAVRGGY